MSPDRPGEKKSDEFPVSAPKTAGAPKCRDYLGVEARVNHKTGNRPGDDMVQAAESEPAIKAKHVRIGYFAALANVSVATIKRRMSAGLIGPAPVLGKLYDRNEVESWFASRDENGKLFGRDRWPFVWSSFQKAQAKRAAG
jgi:hypothetical protein